MSHSRRALFLVNAVIEALILLMICVSPWAFGSVGETAKFYLLVAIATLLALWYVRLLLSSELEWKNCPVALCLAATILLCVFQLAPIGKPALRWMSPGTANLYNELLPSELESLDQQTGLEKVGWSNAGSTISLYPGETRKSLVSFLAIFALFLVVRNNKLSEAGIRRLSFVLLFNGTALALFGLIQFFSTPEAGKIYWSYQSMGSCFGPFINRNHFAFYVNLCIGPAIGLLLATRSSSTSDSLPWGQRLLNSSHELLLTPVALWIGAGLALMLTGVTFCLSRGGLLAMLSGAIPCLLLVILQGSKNLRLLTVFGSAMAASGLLLWFGTAAIEARLGTLWTGEAMEDDRVFVMTHAWQLVSQFPIFGTGTGTFQFIEPLALHTPKDVGAVYEHAHNDYLEDLLEGGAVRLLLRLVAIGFVFRFAVVAYRKHSSDTMRAMILGMLFSFTSVVVHSFFEFGLYVSSIAVLTTVLCGNICNLGEITNASEEVQDPSAIALQRIALLGGLMCVVLFGWFFWTEGSKAIAIQTLEGGNTRRETAVDTRPDIAADITLLYNLAKLEPLNAQRRFAVAQAHFYLHRLFAGQTNNPSAESSARRQLDIALAHTVHSRNLCPLLPEPHTRLAAHAGAFAKADSKNVYIDRAKRLAPADPELWYVCGLQELADNQPELAWQSWRRSLQLSDIGLTRILDRAITILSPTEMLQKLLPDQPEILLAAAIHLYPEPDAVEDRQAMLQRALEFYSSMSSSQLRSLLPADQRTRAMVYRFSGQPERAVEAYHMALALEPQQIEWRFELVMALLATDNTTDAKNELGLILGQQPNHTQARQLLDELKKEN